MYYYRKKRKKSNKAQSRQIIVEKPLNEVWESFQEPKSYNDYGIPDEAFAFLSNRERCDFVRKRNQYWKEKSNKCGKFCLIVFPLMTISLIYLLDAKNTFYYIIPAILVLSFLSLIVTSFVFEHKIINSYDGFERKYQEYVKYKELYEEKKKQYIIHTNELEVFRNNEAPFVHNIAERLKRVQGRVYRTEDDWLKMSDRDFEFEVGKVYNRLGYQTQVTKRSGDGGVDVIAKKDNEIIYIQCKHYAPNTHLGAPELQAFWGCCSGNGIKKGVMVCTSSLTKDASAFANKLKGKLEIVGMKELLVLDKTFYQSHPINSQKQFTDAFKTFISSNNFIDCDHLWLKSKVYHKEEDAKKDMETLTKWKSNTYLLKDTIVNLTNKIRVYVILLVPDYALEEVKSIQL